MIGICLTARAVEPDKRAQQLHYVSLDFHIGGANAFRLACKMEQNVSIPKIIACILYFCRSGFHESRHPSYIVW